MIITSLLATLFVLGVLIFVHEFGHFIVAKRLGVKVERFSLGYPPKMIGFTRGDTEYCISWIPFGGYVKMAGENPDEDEIKGEPYEFQSKSIGVRALIIAAGPVMNFLTAIIILWMVYFFIGMAVADTETTKIGTVLQGNPAELAGIMPDDEIISVNGIEVYSFSEMADIIHGAIEEPVVVKWLRDGEPFIATITTVAEDVMLEDGSTKMVGMIGVGPSARIESLGFFKAFAQGATATISISKEILKFVYGLFSASISLEMIGGPILIAQMAGQTASQGFSSLLMFTALLSVNLAILNVLPIPVLDGGHLVFLFVEKIRGKPLSIDKRMRIQQVGMALLLILMLVVTYNDIIRLIG
ncbi:MAG: RIP metalloprotease RseP [candidate division Zixibacteria bacterium]|nr:RIP metalloprotease RseP [candidate division Zixibacteria bacterium]